MFVCIENLLRVNESPPQNLSAWLRHKASLTDKLKVDSGDAVLQVLCQAWVQPNWWDRYSLGLREASVIHRDIFMLSQQIPVWFARTIIPKQSYEENRTFFERLKQESLGVIIFNEPQIKRKFLFNYGIDEGCLEFQWLPASLKIVNRTLWLRFSEFTITKTSNFYLVEILLPGLEKVIN